jgi:hypothetical protein
VSEVLSEASCCLPAARLLPACLLPACLPACCLPACLPAACLPAARLLPSQALSVPKIQDLRNLVIAGFG